MTVTAAPTPAQMLERLREIRAGLHEAAERERARSTPAAMVEVDRELAELDLTLDGPALDGPAPAILH